MAILGINNTPYYDMEPYLDMATFDRLQPEIIRGFADAREFAKEGTWMKPAALKTSPTTDAFQAV